MQDVGERPRDVKGLGFMFQFSHFKCDVLWGEWNYADFVLKRVSYEFMS